MAAKSTKTATPVQKQEPTIGIPVAQAEQLYSLYQNVAVADAHYKSCQAVQFRTHVTQTYTAKNIADAFLLLEQQIKEAKEE